MTCDILHVTLELGFKHSTNMSAPYLLQFGSEGVFKILRKRFLNQSVNKLEQETWLCWTKLIELLVS